MSYTFQKVKANRVDLGLLDSNFYTAWDQRHTVSLVTDYKSGRFSHTLRMDIGSGRADSVMNVGDPSVQDRANPYAVVSYDLSVALPKDSAVGKDLTLSIYNIFNNHQTLQYSWFPGDDRERTAWVPGRFISLGVNKTF